MGRRQLTLIALLVLIGGLFMVGGRNRNRPAEDAGKGTTPVAADQLRSMALPALTAARSANAPGAPALFEFVSPPNARELDVQLPAPAATIRYVRIDRTRIEGKPSPFWQPTGQGKIRLPLPDGDSVTLVIDESEMLGADRFTSRGHIEHHPLSGAVFAYNRGFLHATIDDPELGSFALRAATADLAQFYRIDPARIPGCGGMRLPVVTEAIRQKAAERRARLAEPTPADSPPRLAAAANPQHAEVQVLMAYTQAVLPTLSGTARSDALQSAFDVAIAKVNSAFANSEITARVKLVKVLEVNYARDGAATGPFPNLQNDALDDLYKSDDGIMDEVHAARDQAGADIVCLALNRADSLSSGLSFLLGDSAALENPMFAFSVVQYSNVTGTNVVPHEFGHLFGCAHDRANALSGAGSYSYSYGYTFLASDNRRYHDIMSYPPGQELNYFSNPRIPAPAPAPGGSPGGIAEGRVGESDTARTIEQNAFELSTYRLQTQAPANRGTLINVATLAFSGTGNQVLIGGLVVGGTQPKRVLLRGAGPALNAFGVSGALADPVLRLFSGQNEIANNNDWEIQATGSRSEVRSAAEAVGAFPFPAGGLDAALVTTLAPGPYTVWLQGRDGTTGFGLIEAYDLDRGPDRIVNLSTRGYADGEGRRMTGGFVVQGEPGTTKRILVRVLGPSLARPPLGLTDVMEDPHLELRNAAGELLVRNDDWSMGSQAVAGVTDDFRPLITTYSEAKIAATGFAPGNRREPCILVDLPAGAYTATVTPFEFQSSDPARNQVAQPGLVLLEVYEINGP